MPECQSAHIWQTNLTDSSDRVKLFYISLCYDRPVPQFMPECHRVHIEREGQCGRKEYLQMHRRGYLHIHSMGYLHLHIHLRGYLHIHGIGYLKIQIRIYLYIHVRIFTQI